MQVLDIIVLVVYFVGMALIGFLCMLRVKHQEDFFLGGRSFGKVIQAFAAFGAGTGANDPVTLGRTTYTSGLNGIWGVLHWLFVTPFYWITAVWYRRMRHLTLGDWFVERYQSKIMGAAYALFGMYFYMVYLSVSFSAVGKVCAPLMGTDNFDIAWLGLEGVPIENILVPIVALVVIVYGVIGGLRAAYWTDLIQGVFIILLSVILIPAGLDGLVEKFGGQGEAATGFQILHERVPDSFFSLLDSPQGGEFPLYYIVCITLINLVGIVVQPHFIATGGGSAKSENSARIGLVVGNFLKRLCTVGWALTALIVLALLADNQEIAADPDRVWGVAAREILGPLKLGLVGLMLACLLAALMSSADCYMLVTSALVVRNLYSPFVTSKASEKHYINVGRVVGFVMITGAATISLSTYNVFDQLRMAWEVPVIFAAIFWVGMYWRRATRWAAWLTVAFSGSVFFLLPILLPSVWPGLRTHPDYAVTTDIVTKVVTRKAAPSDVAQREAAIRSWESAPQGTRPEPLAVGDEIADTFRSGGKAIFWTGGVRPVGKQETKVIPGKGEREQLEDVEVTVERLEGPKQGEGFFNLDFIIYELVGIDLRSMPDAALPALRLPPKIIMPFLVIILLSFITPRQRKEELDRFFIKMKTPTIPDPEADRKELELSYQNPDRFDHKKLFPGTQLEFQKPTFVDIAGFILSFAGCFGIIALAVWVASIGG